MNNLSFLYSKYALFLYYVGLFATLAFVGAITVNQLIGGLVLGAIVYMAIQGLKLFQPRKRQENEEINETE